jgi:vancomycin resistance protein YoaR
VIAITALSVLALIITWVGLWVAVGSGLPPKTFFLDVNISKLTNQQAENKISQELSGQLNGKITLKINSESFSIPVKDSGISLDIESALDSIPVRSANPLSLFSALFQTKRITPIIKSDADMFNRAIRVVEREVNVAPKDADIIYEGVLPKVVDSVPGKFLDRGQALRKISKRWLKSDVISLSLKNREPSIANEEAMELLDFAERAVSAPLTITLATSKSSTLSVSPQVIAQSLTFIPGGDEKLAAKWLKATFINRVGKKWTANIVEPINASFSMSGGELRVQPSRDGLDVPEEKLQSGILAALDKTGVDRQVTFTPEPVAARITTKMAGALGIEEVIGTFTTYFPHAEYRIINIQRAARWMDGVVIQPGQVFSYNNLVGERTEARGFVPGIMIDRGVLKKDLGGGVSQVATTTWNAAWFSGLELVQHKPHSFYISRYPAGRESTVAWPNVDVKFRNNSGKPIFVDTSYTDKSVTVTIYGTKFVDVETESGPRTKPVPFKVLENDSEECIFQEGVTGFTIEVWRILKKDGVEVKREMYRTRYLPEDRIICTNPKARWMNPPLDVQRTLANQ